MTTLASTYHHIDNGGVDIDIIEDDFKNISIKINTRYYGYPGVEAVLHLMCHSDVLEKLGIACFQAHGKLKAKQ